MSSIKNYLSLVKFSHTIFAMPFAVVGFFLGYNHYAGGAWWGGENQIMPRQFFDIPDFTLEGTLIKFGLVVLCMITARSGAMAFNRYLDRHFDAKNPRTAIREIPRGIISAESALRFVILSCVLFIISCFFINRICFFLSPVALVVVLFYSYTKRRWVQLTLLTGCIFQTLQKQ